MSTLSAVWTFDPLFFIAPPICISRHLEDFHRPFLEIISTLYPFLLILLTYVCIRLHFHNFKPIVTLWKPFHRIYVKVYRRWDPSASIIQSFSSLFFLSIAKTNFVIYISNSINCCSCEYGRCYNKTCGLY